MARISFIILIILFTLPVFGQITVQFIPEVYGRSIDGLFNCRLTNRFQKQEATLTITVTERKGGTICIIKTSPFIIYPGTNPIPVSAARSAAIQLSNNKLGQITSLTHNFPEGDYDYCFDLTFTHSDNLPDEQCFSYTLAPFTELTLTDPYDKDKICDKRPMFTWQPLLPGVPGAYYQLVLTEIKAGQNATEALNYNLPLINQYSIISPLLPYPPIAPELVQNKQYAWQVTAYKDQTVLIRSEIWKFTVSCQDSLKKQADNGYRDIEDLLRGNYYIADGFIKFAIINPYQKQKLRYQVSSLNHPDKKIRGLPAVQLLNGSNDILIDLVNNSSLSDNEYYILQIWLPNGTTRSLRFLYKEPK